MTKDFSSDTAFAWRAGPLLVVSKSSALPPYCVKCGQPAVYPPLKRSFSWHPQWMYVFLFLGLFIGAIIIAIASSRLTVTLPLCLSHRKKYRFYGYAALFLVLGFIPLMVLGAYSPDYIALGFITGLVAFVTGIVFFYLYQGVIGIQKIDKKFGYFKGVSESFLKLLEPFDESSVSFATPSSTPPLAKTYSDESRKAPARIRRKPGRDSLSMLKRGWLLLSVAWIGIFGIVAGTIYNGESNISNAEAVFLIFFVCLPLILGPILFYIYRFIRYGTLTKPNEDSEGDLRTS